MNSGGDLVLFRSHMTDRAIEAHMVRNGLCASDLGMTSAALVGSLRWLGIVRIMTLDTRLHRVVGDRADLRKTGGT
jgi:hypothetical protein